MRTGTAPVSYMPLPGATPTPADMHQAAAAPSQEMAANMQRANAAHHMVAWTIAIVLAIYLGLAFFFNREKPREALKLSNIRINGFNFLNITFTAILGIVLVKIALTKMAAVKSSWLRWLSVPAHHLLAFVQGA